MMQNGNSYSATKCNRKKCNFWWCCITIVQGSFTGGLSNICLLFSSSQFNIDLVQFNNSVDVS